MKQKSIFARTIMIAMLAICAVFVMLGCDKFSGGKTTKEDTSLTAKEPNQNPAGYSEGYNPRNLQGIISQRLNLYPVDALSESRNAQWNIICAYLYNIGIADCRKLAATWNEEIDKKTLNNIEPNEWLLSSKGDFFLIDLEDLNYIRFKHYRSHGDYDDAYRAPNINSSDLTRYTLLKFINNELPDSYISAYQRFAQEFNNSRPPHDDVSGGQNGRGDSGYSPN